MDDSKQEIMEATRSALRSHSYSELSIQDIADEFEKSKSLLYHHYDGKDEILLDFLDHILEEFQEEALSESEKEIEEEFRDKAFMAFDICEECSFMKTLTELRTQALRDDRYREKFERFEELYTGEITELLKEGQKKGVFQKKIDPEQLAEFINFLNYEALFRRATESPVEKTREELENYLELRVFRQA
jgi:AcrR family transcriptional regulator